MSEKAIHAEFMEKIRKSEKKESNNKKVLDRLMQSEAHYRLLVESSNDIIWFFDLESMTFSFYSSSVREILGYSQEDEIVATLDVIFPPSAKSRVISAFTDLIGKKEGLNRIVMEAEHQRKDGTKIWMEISAALHRDHQGKPLFFTGVSRDITKRKQIEAERNSLIEKLQTALEALTLSEKRFRSLFEDSMDAIVSMDMENNFLMVNPAGMALFGLADHELASCNFQDFFVDPAAARKFSASIRPQGYLRDFGAQLYGKQGLIMDCLITASAKRAADGAMTGYEGIVRDVTPFKKMQEELRRMATTDFLTGINNRRNFMELAEKEMNRSRRYKHPCSLLMLDIDHFKKINDTYGHSAGDKVLIEFCMVCLKELRENDVFGRIGGEEFAIVLVESDANKALFAAERIRQSVASNKMNYDDEAKINLTVSIGITEMLSGDDLNSIFERADTALYHAKESGRNRVKIS